MGRPTNKRFFSGGVGTTIGCTIHDGGGVIESAIISQRSNSQFRVAGVGGTPITGTTLVFADADPDTIADSGASWADFTLVFSAGDSVRVIGSEGGGENDGVYEIATVTADLITLTDNGVLVANAADTTATLSLVASAGILGRLVQGVPNAAGEMRVTVTPELIQVGVQATLNVTASGGAITVLTINNAGFGYFAPGTGVVVAGGTAGTCDYTVNGAGSLATVTRNNDGSAYADGPAEQDIGDTPDANAPVESAKIINARTVKTFEGNIYQWPATGGEGTPEVRGEADLQSTDL